MSEPSVANPEAHPCLEARADEQQRLGARRDGTSASGSWDTDPPVDLEHTYATRDFYTDTGPLRLTLTVTDAAGHADTDTLSFALVAANDV